MEQSLAVAWVVLLVLKILWILMVPGVILLSVVLLWRVAPRWIPMAFGCSALLGLLATVPGMLIHMNVFSVAQHGRMAVPLAVIGGLSRLLLVAAVLGLALQFRRMAGTPLRMATPHT